MFQPWPDSISPIEGISAVTETATGANDKLVVYFIAALLLVSLLFFGKVAEAFFNTGTLFGRSSKMREVARNKYKCNAIRFTFLLMIPVYASVFSYLGLSSLEYWKVLVVFVTYFMFRFLLQKTIIWLAGRKEGVNQAALLFHMAFIIIALLSLLALGVFRAFPEIPMQYVELYLIVMSVVILAVFFFQESRIFISSRFSVVFLFLYLCALEILPMCVAIKVVVS